jgi:hypothetical protein
MLAGTSWEIALPVTARTRAMSRIAPPQGHSDPSGRSSSDDFKGSFTKFLHDNMRLASHVPFGQWLPQAPGRIGNPEEIHLGVWSPLVRSGSVLSKRRYWKLSAMPRFGGLVAEATDITS